MPNKRVWFILCLGVIFLANGGCTPLKKKFTRKKKEEKGAGNKFIPILEPIVYPEKVRSPKEEYKQHYSLWLVWNKDLLQQIEMEGSDKRQKYLLNQCLEHLNEMHQYLDEARQSEFGGLINNLTAVLKDYERPPSMRSKFSMRTKINRNARTIRSRYAPDMVFQAPTPQP